MQLKMIARHLSFVILPVLVAGCATQSPSPGLTPLPPIAKDIEPARKALREADQGFAKLAQKSGLAQAFYQFLAPNATVLLPEAQPLEGREVVRIQLSAHAETVSSWQTTGSEISESGDLGFTWGTFESSAKPAGAQIEHTYGKYLSVWKKQPDGNWRIVLHSSNSSPPPNTRR